MTYAINTIADFGFAAGTADKGLAEQAAKWHKAYVKASEAKQDQMRTDYCHNYLMGKYGYKLDAVETIAAMTKSERSEADQRAWNNAQSNFNYRVVTNCGQDKPLPQQAEVKLTRAQMQAIKACKALGVTAAMFKSVK